MRSPLLPEHAQLTRPRLFTFDIFGTVLDWRRGLVESLARRGIELGPEDFDRVIDLQGELEQAGYRRYTEIVADSLVETLRVPRQVASAIGEEVGRWPLFADSAAAMRRLASVAPCVAMTNSDRVHGEDVTRALGAPMQGWISAEDVRVYKPARAFWEATREKRRIEPGPSWWHVSAYADYDLDVAKSFGLTTVFVRRPHSREGAADLVVHDLAELADRVEART